MVMKDEPAVEDCLDLFLENYTCHNGSWFNRLFVMQAIAAACIHHPKCKFVGSVSKGVMMRECVNYLAKRSSAE